MKGDEARSVGFGIVQLVDKIGTEFYLGLRNYDFERVNTDLNNIFAFITGANGHVPDRGETVILRPVYSVDGMTAEFAKLPLPVLQEMARTIGQLPTVDLVCFDVSNKPPATIEWE